MKSPYYVATVVNAYRRRLDGCTDIDMLQHELNCISHRPYSNGFYFGEMKKYIPDEQLPYIHECTFAGTVIDCKNGILTIEQRGKFSVGDTMEILSPESIGLSFKIEKIINSYGNETESACHAQEIVSAPCPYELKKGDILRIKDK